MGATLCSWQALARLNAIGASINRISWGDSAGVEATLHLIVESAIEMVPAHRRSSTPRRAAPGAGPGLTRRRRPGCRAADGRRAAARWPGRAAPSTSAGRAFLRRTRPGHPPRQAARPAPRSSSACRWWWPTSRWACFTFTCTRSAGFSQLELLLLDNFVNQAAMAIYHAGQLTDVRRDLARKEDELTLLRHAGLLISSRTRLEETLEAILQMALEVTGARYGIFRLVDRAGQNLVMRAIAGEHLGRPAVEALPINTTSVMGWVAKTRQPLNIADVQRPALVAHLLPAGSRPADALRAGRAADRRRRPAGGGAEPGKPAASARSPRPTATCSRRLATQAVIAIQEVRLLDALQEMAERLLTQPAQQVLDHLVALACDLLGGSRQRDLAAGGGAAHLAGSQRRPRAGRQAVPARQPDGAGDPQPRVRDQRGRRAPIRASAGPIWRARRAGRAR